MGSPFEKSLAWLTALAAVSTFYAHLVVPLRATTVTAAWAAILAVGLVAMSLCWMVRPLISTPTSAMRKIAAFALASAWGLFTVIGLYAFTERAPTMQDWGLFLVEVATPVLLLTNNARIELLRAIGMICVLFACADALANLLAWRDIIQLPAYGGRYGEFGRITRYPGLSGNSHAAGLVAMIAVCFLSSRLQIFRGWGWSVAATLVAVLFCSMILIDARRYTGEAMAALLLIMIGSGRMKPLWIFSIWVGLVGIYWTFHGVDFDDDTRASLMTLGWRDVLQSPWTGHGLFYRVPPEWGGFDALWASRVTESGAIDLAVAYGLPAAALFIFAALAALASRRQHMTWAAAYFCVTTGQLAFGDAISGFLGAILYFGSMLTIICDEMAIERRSLPTELSLGCYSPTALQARVPFTFTPTT